MAEATRNQIPSGYDEDFVNAVEDEVLCLICQLPQKEPVLTRCGHRFCKDCLEEHFRRQEGQPLTCPMDRQTLDRDRDIFPEKATQRKILSFTIRCPSDGCEWTGELRYKQTHLASCPIEEVPCTNKNCQATMKRKDLSEHVGVTCQWRIIKCEHCSEPHPKCQMEDHIREKCKLLPLPCPHMCGAHTVRKLELQDHFATCKRFPVRCPNNCEAVIPREEVSNHIEDDCPLTKIPCPYARMGCRQKVQRDQLESHLQHETRSHLDLTCFELNDTQEKVKEKSIQLDRLEERVNAIQQQHQYNVNFLKQEYQQKVRILQNQLEQKVNTTQTKLEQKLSTERKIFFVCLLLSLVCLISYLTKLEDGVHKNLEEKVDSLNTNITSYLTKLEDRIENNLKEKISVLQSQHEKKVSMVKKNLEDKMDSLNTRLRVIEESRIFTWKITSFAIKLRLAVESDPFYMYGYKLKVRLHPNGGGTGENTHLSIYLVVMKGEYDAMLPWPFKKKVTFTLIDQQEDPDERKNVPLSFIPGDIPECFARPTQEENSAGHGFPQFISHEKLHSRHYLVDDTLFLQVEIGP